MGKEDRKEKVYFADRRRYADLWNGAVFHGKQVIHSEELEDMNTVMTYAEGGEHLEQMTDLMMKQVRGERILAAWIQENQSEVDYSMPVKVLLQEALEYHRQVKVIKQQNYISSLQIEGIFQGAGEYLYRFRKQDKLYPVTTLVVYWGEEDWDGPKSLHELLDFGEDEELAQGLKALVPECPIHFVNLMKLEDYEVFQTELRTLFALYARKNDKVQFWEYVKEHEECRYLDRETYELLAMVTHSGELEKMIAQQEKKKEDGDMCKAITDLIADGKAEGKAEDILDLLEDLGEVPEQLRPRILSETDMDTLRRWLKLAARAGGIEQFCAQTGL